MKTAAFLFSIVLLGACASKAESDAVATDQRVSDTLTESPMESAEEEKVAEAAEVDATTVEEEVPPVQQPLTVKPERKIRSLKTELIGPKWRMTELASKKVQKKPEPYYINFEEENQFTAYAGCNHYNGSFKVKGSKITFSDIMGTKMACDDMQEETYLNEVLRTVSAYQIINGELQLLEKSKVVARFI